MLPSERTGIRHREFSAQLRAGSRLLVSAPQVLGLEQARVAS